MTRSSLLGSAFAVALIASPALALANTNTMNPTNTTNATNTVPVTTNTAMAGANVGDGGYTGMAMPIPAQNNNNNNNNANNRPSQRNGDLADNGDARASKVIGTTVFNQQDQKLGSVDDILIGRNGVFAVISTDKQKVAVPFQHLVFGDAQQKGDDKLVIENVTQAQLDTMPAFHYDATNYANNNNNKNGNVLWGNRPVTNTGNNASGTKTVNGNKG